MVVSEQYWDRQLETLAPDHLARVQDHRLQWQIQRCWLASPFYRARIEQAGLGPRDVRARADLARLPILTDRDLRADLGAHPPRRSTAVAPPEWWAATRPAAHPDGGQLVSTDGDLIHQSSLIARALWAFGVRDANGASPRIELRAVDPATREAAESAIAAGIARLGPHGHSEADAAPRATWHVGAPTATIIAPSSASDEPFLAIGHGRIGTTLAAECDARLGLHWAEDHFLLEIVDTLSFAPAESGAIGGLVLTHLTREGNPLIRYWTGIKTSLDASPCPCGRTGARSVTIAPI